MQLARAAVADGTSTVVATPHVRTDFVTEPLELSERVREVREALARAGVPLAVRCGGELGHDLVGILSQAQLEAIAQGPAGNRWLLVEAPFEGLRSDFHAATAELRERGFAVVIAHPERVAFAATEGLRGAAATSWPQGCVGAGERAVAHRGRTAPRRAPPGTPTWRTGLVGLVASDAHGRRGRRRSERRAPR